jgi:reactive intermediate/imine deaminase
MRKTLSSAKVSKPSGVFAHGVSVAQPARLVFVSGMLGRDASGRLVGPDIRSQTRQVLENIKAVLAEDGATMADVVKVLVFIRDMGDFAAIHEVRREYFPSDRLPASTMVQIARFTDPDALIEIEAVAAVPAGR